MTVLLQLYLIVDVERRVYECPAYGALCRLHQYKRKLFAHQVLNKGHRHRSRVPKLRYETCDRYQQIPILWVRSHVLYMKMLEREFFTLLGNSVNRIAELCRIRLCVA